MTKQKSKEKLIGHLKNRNPKLTNEEIDGILAGLRRFVLLVQKIYTEPQSTLKLIDVKVGKKVVRKDLLISTTMDEIAKTKNGHKNVPLLLAFREAYKVATKGKKKNGN